MLRLGEAFFALAPLLAAALLWAVVYRRLPSRRAVLVIALAELVFAGAVIWQGVSEGLAPHERYVPAHFQGGVVRDGRGG